MNAGTFNGTGADCSGSSGVSNRILILSNTGMTSQEGFLVYASGLALALTTEYTVSHNSTNTEITFLNPLWDDMTVVVKYYQSTVPGLATDFLLGPLGDFGVTATRTPVTITTDFSGNKTYTDGTDEDIAIVIQPYNEKYDLDESGLKKNYDLTIYVGPAVTLNKYDKITYASKIYRVDNVTTRDFNGTTVMKKAVLFFIANA